MHVILDMEVAIPGCNGKLWLGGQQASTDIAVLENNGITVLLPASRKPEPVESLNVKILDYVDGTALVNNDYHAERFLDVVDQIIDYLKRGHGVLVSCYNGAHRSASEVCVIVMRITGWDFQRAENYICSLRNCVDLQSVAPPSSHRRNPQRPSAWLSDNEGRITDHGFRMLANNVRTPVAYRKMAMELGFESISARPKSKARTGRNSGFSSYEMVSSAAEAAGAKDEMGGTTLSSSGGDPASSSLSSAEASAPGLKRSRADSGSEFTLVNDELNTKEKRANKLAELCNDLHAEAQRSDVGHLAPQARGGGAEPRREDSGRREGPGQGEAER